MGFRSWLKDKVSDAADSISNAANSVKETVSSAASAVGDAAQAVGRTVEVGTQGVVRGLASGTASLGDLGVFAYNHTVRHGINAFRENDLEKANLNLAGRAAEGVTWTEPRNDYERGLMAAGQAVGEVGAVVAVTVATAGVGGAVMGGGIAAARGTAIGARAIPMATRAASATARFMNPAASRLALGIEGGAAGWRTYDLYTTDAQAAENEVQILEGVGDTLADNVEARYERLNKQGLAIKNELSDLTEELNSGELSIEQIDAHGERFDALLDGLNIIDRLTNEDLSVEEIQELENELNEIVEPESSENTAETSSIYSREAESSLSAQFGQGYYEGGNGPSLEETTPSLQKQLV